MGLESPTHCTNNLITQCANSSIIYVHISAQKMPITFMERHSARSESVTYAVTSLLTIHRLTHRHAYSGQQEVRQTITLLQKCFPTSNRLTGPSPVPPLHTTHRTRQTPPCTSLIHTPPVTFLFPPSSLPSICAPPIS